MLSLKYAVRKYEPQDEGAVLALCDKYASWDATPTSADVQGFWAREPDLFLVAEVEGRVVGFVCGQESKHLPEEALRKRKATRAGSIEILAVAEEHRRRGVATALLDKLFEAFRERGIDYVSLAVPAEEVGARKLYEKLGFQPRAYFLSKRL